MRINGLSEAEVVRANGRPWVRLTLHADPDLTGRAGAGVDDGHDLAVRDQRLDALAARVREIVRRLDGADPLATESLVDRFLTVDAAEPGEVEARAVSLVELACRDLAGRAFGLPAYRLLGGPLRDRIPACAVGWAPDGLADDATAREAQRLVRAGFRTLSFDPFGPGTPPDPDPASLRTAVRLAETVRAAVGPDVALWIDLKARFVPPAASRFARLLERVDPAGIADPVPPARLPLAPGTWPPGIAIASGHRLGRRPAFARLLTGHGCDLARLDASRCGGFTEALKIASLADSLGARVSLTASPGPLAAHLHLATALPNLAFIEADPADDLSTFALLPDGSLPVPTDPGLGSE